MTILVNNQEKLFPHGEYVCIVELTTGTAKLQIKTAEMVGFVDIPDSSVSASAAVNLSLKSNSTIKAVISNASTNLVLVGSTSITI
tara:strand:- start:917 stop:1174 length:258 start_codon:yes stop_codon:yes gene_type:complete